MSAFTVDGINGTVTGEGPPLLLLRGIPETHLMWEAVTPALASRFTVVATDLRGFGDSHVPPSAPDHAPYAMRSLAAEQVAVMRQLGFDSFAVVGHDRGARCAYRMALDHPSVVTALAVLDVVPTASAFARADKDFAMGFWVWSFLAAPFPVPERLLAHDPAALVAHMLDTWADSDVFTPSRRAAYLAQFTDPDRVHAICEQYRAAATLDDAHDRADHGVHRISCPVLALWSATGALAAFNDDPLAIWREWADDVGGHALACGHFLPEEAPAATADALLAFLPI